MKKRRWLLVSVGCRSPAGSGGGGRLLLTHRRDVTTTSDEAYQAYREGVANERRFYFKEARAGFAKALELDPELRDGDAGAGPPVQGDDQGLALVRRAAKEKDRLTERERLHVDMQLGADREAHGTTP